ncbi:MAG: helix-turn-helix domain-containing protein [Solirubrobacteraceae bacterium]
MSSSNLIRRARRSAGMTQAQLAAALGVSQPVVARLESVGANPTYATLDRALRATGHGLELTRRTASAGLDLGQLRERMKLSPAQRLSAFAASQRNLSELAARARPIR